MSSFQTDHTAHRLAPWGVGCKRLCGAVMVVGLLPVTPVLAQADWSWPLEPPTFRVGDSWSYRQTDLFNGRADPQPAELRVHARNGDMWVFRGRYTDGRAWNFTADAEFNSLYKVRGEEQINRSFQWPLAADTAWRNDRKRLSNDALVEQKETCEVKGRETVEVPAGRFEAAKVQCKVFWSNDMQASGNGDITRWYAPAVKQWVRTEERWWLGRQLHSQTRRELLSFNPGAGSP